MPQLIDVRHVSSSHPLRHLDQRTNHARLTDRILRHHCLDADEADTGILRAAVMGAVAQISDPGLQRRRVVLLDVGAVSADAGLAADGRPFAGRGEEGQVDVGVGGEVVGFARFGVGVED
jgi:hypothetical protein